MHQNAKTKNSSRNWKFIFIQYPKKNSYEIVVECRSDETCPCKSRIHPFLVILYCIKPCWLSGIVTNLIRSWAAWVDINVVLALSIVPIEEFCFAVSGHLIGIPRIRVFNKRPKLAAPLLLAFWFNALLKFLVIFIKASMDEVSHLQSRFAPKTVVFLAVDIRRVGRCDRLGIFQKMAVHLPLILPEGWS